VARILCGTTDEMQFVN